MLQTSFSGGDEASLDKNVPQGLTSLWFGEHLMLSDGQVQVLMLCVTVVKIHKHTAV